MSDDELSPQSQQAMDLVREALYCTPELQANPGKRAAGLVAVLIAELSQIQDQDERETALDTFLHDIARLVPISAKELEEATVIN
jgi:hypothetical protein